jgi:diphthine-ammonia ligase
MTTVLGIVRQGHLVPEDIWKKLILSLSPSFDGLETNKERSKRILEPLLIESVKKRMTKKTGILLSGGVDSTTLAFIAKKLGHQPLCYTVGLENSDDLQWANKAAAEHGFTLKQKILSLDELEQTIKEVIKITKQCDIITVGVGVVTHQAAKMAKEDGCDAIMTGLGSEELFAGYERHLKALDVGYEEVHKECISGLTNMRNRDLVRDVSIAQQFHLDIAMPFLDKEFMKAALAVHPMNKIDKTANKIILREMAEHIGLQKDFAQRKKKAAQYGSSVVAGIEKLSKRKGFALKKDYLNSLV